MQFQISHEDGVYTASGVNAPIVTEGSTFEELQDNIRDAVALYFEGDDPAALQLVAPALWRVDRSHLGLYTRKVRVSSLTPPATSLHSHVGDALFGNVQLAQDQCLRVVP